MTKEQTTLRTNAIIIAAFGVIFAFATLTPIYNLIAIFFDVAHWPFNAAPDALDATGRLMIAIGGGLTVGLAAMTWTIATDVLPAAPDAGRKVIRRAALAWFVTDSTFSVLAGSPVNAVLNLIFLALMLLPLARSPRAATA